MSSGLFVMGLLVSGAGCHGRRDRAKEAAPTQTELADRGRAEIVEGCGKQSYDLMSKGLIVSETGLHEDVFVLRDRMTLGGIGYSLDEALRLESQLNAEAKGGAHPAEQSECIAKFAAHLETLSSPLVEGDQRLKELDASAFVDSAKEAEKQAEKKLRGPEKPQDEGVEPPEKIDY
ncbi:MAG: hypothetical protein WDN23_15485 [Edaphobacter sp.]